LSLTLLVNSPFLADQMVLDPHESRFSPPPRSPASISRSTAAGPPN